MLDHAIKQYGLDRTYTVEFNAKGDISFVLVRENGDLLVIFWLEKGVMGSNVI